MRKNNNDYQVFRYNHPAPAFPTAPFGFGTLSGDFLSDMLLFRKMPKVRRVKTIADIWGIVILLIFLFSFSYFDYIALNS